MPRVFPLATRSIYCPTSIDLPIKKPFIRMKGFVLDCAHVKATNLSVNRKVLGKIFFGYQRGAKY